MRSYELIIMWITANSRYLHMRTPQSKYLGEIALVSIVRGE